MFFGLRVSHEKDFDIGHKCTVNIRYLETPWDQGKSVRQGMFEIAEEMLKQGFFCKCHKLIILKKYLEMCLGVYKTFTGVKSQERENKKDFCNFKFLCDR